MFNRIMRTLATAAIFLSLTVVPGLVEGASDIGDPAKLEAVLLNGEKINLDKWKGKEIGRASCRERV